MIGSPYCKNAYRVLLLGGGELGKELVIESRELISSFISVIPPVRRNATMAKIKATTEIIKTNAFITHLLLYSFLLI